MMDYSVGTQQFGLSHELSSSHTGILRVEVPVWEEDISALLLLDGKNVHSSCLSNNLIH